MKVYAGGTVYAGRRDRLTGECLVWSFVPGEAGTARPLPMRRDLCDYSQGFEWGYGGSGPAQLALALLADCLGDDEAVSLHDRFKWEVVANLPAEWRLTAREIIKWKE